MRETAQLETLVSPSPTAAASSFPKPGESFGSFRIVRLLGQGGMGAVFEAEDMECGRRLALKVLGQRLDSPQARSRFLREGRLAASVNHPNSVYVFGTEDIAGIPVIAMELVAGGNLQEKVLKEGPMEVRRAVESILQVVAGLEAAQRAGVLHRDIKPSNCFVETDGAVKIGDFGLSISTQCRAEPTLTASDTFVGTPAFSPPEQLRGDELTVRSDIYSVGGTLYYLLTGHHPFEAQDMVRLLAAMLERRPESPARWRAGLPARLCRVVLRCLEKDPNKRFCSYAELREALLPYISPPPAPATPGPRLAAYCLDVLLLALPASLLNMLLNLLVQSAGQAGRIDFSQSLMAQLAPSEAPELLLHSLCGMGLAVVYFAVFEGLWGASIGKRICGLRVARLDHTTPGVRRALVRALILTAAPTVVWLSAWNVARAWSSDPSLQHWLAGLGLLVLPSRLLMFVNARRYNGYAGFHDLISATRVSVRSGYGLRPELPPASEELPRMEGRTRIGPYEVLSRLDTRGGADLLLGFDPRLLRRVWIWRLPAGTPPIPAARRELRRPGRLRWLTGRRTGAEAWDAYEAPPGQPLLKLMAQPQPWSRVRYWLLDLAEELLAVTQDATLSSSPSLDRLWITEDGHAKLLDFAAPGSAAPDLGTVGPGEPALLTSQAFLRKTAACALEGYVAEGNKTARPVAAPIALHATEFLQSIESGCSLKECVGALRRFLGLPAQITRQRRAVLLGGAMLVPVLTIALIGGSLTLIRSAQTAEPGLATLQECLVHHHELQRQAKSAELAHSGEVDALEVYIAGRFASIITNAAEWNRPAARLLVTYPYRAEAEQIVARRGVPAAGQFAQASETVKGFFRKLPDDAARESFRSVNPFLGAAILGYVNTLLIVVVPSLCGSLLFHGGALVKLLGIVFVDRRNRPASRWRVTARCLVAWLPIVLLPIGFRWLAPVLGPTRAILVAAGLASILALLSLLLPQRGLADRLAGTWLVPR